MLRPKVIDADGHVMEHQINWQEVLPADLRGKAPKSLSGEVGGIFIEGRIISGPYYPTPIVRGTEGPMGAWHTHPARSGMWDPHKRMKDMDLEGIDTAVLFGGGTGLGVSGLRDKRLAVAMARGYNDWLAEYCHPYPGRLKGVAALPMQDVGEAVKELRRCVKQYGFIGACVPVNVHGRPMDDPDCYPFYAACQEMDVPVCIHNTTTIDGPGGERFTSFVRQKAILDPFEMMIASMSLILGGVFDDFPKLKVAFLESGVGWVPYWMDRLDDYYEEFKEKPLKKHLPSDYFKSEQVFVSCEVDEKTIAFASQTMGDGHVIYASDYLHHDAKFPRSVAAIQEREDLSSSLKAKVLADNAARLFKLKV